MKTIPLYLEGKRIVLRPLETRDTDAVTEYSRDKKVTKWTSNIPSPYTKQDALRFVRETRRDSDDQTAFVFAIEPKETSACIGTIGLREIDWKEHHAIAGYALNSRWWGKDIMTEAMELLLVFGFRFLQLHRVAAECFEANHASIRVMKKSGLQREGMMREREYRYGTWHNIILYSILKKEFRMPKK